MSKVNSGWVRRQAAVLLSATLALSPVMAVPATAAETGDDAPAVETTTEKDVEAVEKDGSATEETAEPVGAETTSEPDASADAVSNEIAPQAETTIEPRAAAVATVKFLDGSTKEYETLASALSAATAGSTVTLEQDVALTKSASTKNFGVTVDLNGHNVTSTGSGAALELKTTYGAKPAEGIDNSLRLINSVPASGGTVTGAIPVAGKAGDSTKPVAIEIGEGVTLVSTSGENADLVQLNSSAYLVYSDATSGLVRNGGFTVEVGGEQRIYGSFANAASAAGSGATVTMLNDYVGTSKIASGSASTTLDLAGHTYTYTGSQTVAEVNYDNASLSISNGTLVGTNDSADGVRMLYSGSSLVLDGVSIKVPGPCYGIVTNGTKTDNSITLHNSTLSVPEGYGIYFPSTGLVTIDNSTIEAKFSGVQMCAGSLVVKGDKTFISVMGQPQEKTEDDGVIADGAAISVVKREGYQDLGSVSITGGTFTSASGVNAVKAYSFSNENKTEGDWAAAGDVVVVSGGSFSSEVPADLCADGLIPVTDADGNHTVAPSESAVATVSSADGSLVGAYDTLAAAVSAAPEGSTIALLGDVTESVTISADKTVTLDLAGHTLTNANGEHTVTVAEGGSLTVTDSSAEKTGTIDNVSHGKAALFNDQGGTVTLNGGTLNRSKENGSSAVQSGGNSFYTLQNYGSMTINEGVTVRQGSDEEGGKFSSLIENGWYNGNNNTSQVEATMVINGGSFVGGLNTIKNDDWGVLTINGGSFTNTAQAAVLNWNKTTITGGEFQSDQYAVLNGQLNDSMDTGELVIEGGTFTGGDGYEVVSQMDGSTSIGTVAISGGEFWTAPSEEFIVPGSGLNKNENGSYGVHEHKLEAVAAKDPTCTEVGNKAYWRCSVCGDLFFDEAMEQPTTPEGVTIAATRHQNVTHVDAKDATETEAGNHEHWFCADCGRYFLDEALTKEATLADVTIPAKGQEAETYTVTFVWTQGTKVVYNDIADGSILNPPTDAPELDGWTFTGRWFTDAACTEEFDFENTPVTGDLTLYAGWLRDAAEEPTTPQTPKDEDVKKGDGLAQTGDATAVAPFVASAVAGASALAAGAATLRRRR